MRSSNATFYANLLGHRTGIVNNVRGNVIIRHRLVYTYVAVARINDVAGFVRSADRQVGKRL